MEARVRKVIAELDGIASEMLGRIVDLKFEAEEGNNPFFAWLAGEFDSLHTKLETVISEMELLEGEF